MPIAYRELTQDDLKQPSLDGLNALLREVIEELNRRQGIGGPVLFESAADMQGNRVSNLAAPQAAGDAVSKEYAEANFVTLAKLQKTLEATGSNILQTTRRLNDTSQQELYSTFLNQTGDISPNSNNSTATVVANGANSDITITAGTVDYPDGSKISYAQRLDTVANPGSGSHFYYYYYDLRAMAVRFAGPFTADTDQNRLEARRDGRAFIAAAKVNAAGGGTAGGGGSGGTGGGGDGFLFF